MASSDKPRIAVLEFKNKADNSYFVDDGDLDLMLGNSGPENSGGQTGSSGDLSVVGEVSVNGAISATIIAATQDNNYVLSSGTDGLLFA
jgi:hypothetical protein